MKKKIGTISRRDFLKGAAAGAVTGGSARGGTAAGGADSGSSFFPNQNFIRLSLCSGMMRPFRPFSQSAIILA